MDRLSAELRAAEKRSRNVAGHIDDWPDYGSSLLSYAQTFAELGFGVGDFKKLVKTHRNPVVIDIMASSSAIAEMFSESRDPGKIGVAVSLEDARSFQEKERDKKIGVKTLVGDLNISKTWKELRQILGTRKANLIVERGGAGVQNLPFNEKSFYIMLNRLWGLTSEQNGIMLIQCPTTHTLNQTGIRLKEWVNLLDLSGINVEYSPGKDPLGMDYAVMKFTKSSNRWKDLPNLKEASPRPSR